MFSLIIYLLIAAIGFMMGFLYKRSNTTAQFFNPKPQKALRIFIVVFVLAVLVTFALSCFAAYSLNSSKIPDEGMLKFQNAKSVMIFVTSLFLFLLVIFANAYSQSLKKLVPLPYILSIGFYIVFTLTDAYYISDYLVLWQKSLQLFQGNLTDFHSTGWMKCGLAFIVTTFNAFMIWWGLKK